MEQKDTFLLCIALADKYAALLRLKYYMGCSISEIG